MSSADMHRSGRRQWSGWTCIALGLLAVAVTSRVAGAQLRGDANCDGVVNGDDLAALIAAIYADSPFDCAATDVNGDGGIDGSDIVALMHILNAPPPTPVPSGATVTFFGLAGADGVRTNPLGETNGTPVFFRNSGSGFKIVVEGATGLSGAPPGPVTFNSSPVDPSRLPDLLIESNNPLGDGSVAVCDGGVPAVDPPDFGSTQAVANALNDFACNFLLATSPSFACTQDEFGDTDFFAAGTQVQFCLQVPKTLAFLAGDTVVSLRLRDTIGNLGPLRQVILRVGAGPAPPTFTVTPTPTPVTPRPTRTPTATHTPTSVTRPSFSPSLTPTVTPGVTPGTPTRSPTHPTATATPPTPSGPTRTSTRTPTVTATPSRTRTPTKTATPSPTVSPTPAQPIGPVITFFGLALADDSLVPPPTPNADGVPVYARSNGTQFSLVVEAAPGLSGVAVGRSAYQMSLSGLPDLQVEVSQPLGNGSDTVCDRTGAMAGGVPKTDPPDFSSSTDVIKAVNDLGCRFLDGNGVPFARKSNEACTKFPPTDDSGFVSPDSTVQFCGFIDRVLAFPPGDTVVTARAQDEDGNAGPPAQIVIHVGP